MGARGPAVPGHMGMIHKRLVPSDIDFFIRCSLALNLLEFGDRNLKVVVTLDVFILTVSRCLARSLVMETHLQEAWLHLSAQPRFCALLAILEVLYIVALCTVTSTIQQ